MKKTMKAKRITALLMAAVMGLSLAACSKDAPSKTDSGTVNPDGSVTKTFKEAMTEDGIWFELYKDKVAKDEEPQLVYIVKDGTAHAYKCDLTMGELSKMSDEEIIAAFNDETWKEELKKIDTAYENYQWLLDQGFFDGNYYKHWYYYDQETGATFDENYYYDFSDQKEAVVNAVNEWKSIRENAESTIADYQTSFKFEAETDNTGNYVIREAMTARLAQPVISGEKDLDEDLFTGLGIGFDENGKMYTIDMIDYFNKNGKTNPETGFRAYESLVFDKERSSYDEKTKVVTEYYSNDGRITFIGTNPRIEQDHSYLVANSVSGTYTIFDSEYSGFVDEYNVLLKRNGDQKVTYTLDPATAEGIEVK